MALSRKFILDLLERTLWTFVQTAAGVIVASSSFGVEVWKAALVAGGLAVVKCLAASQVGNRDSASTLPHEPVAPPATRKAAAK